MWPNPSRLCFLLFGHFSIYGYDHFFARMPCGTYHFLLRPLLDPSEAFNTARDFLTVLSLPLVGPLLFVFPILAVLLSAELKHTIQDSTVFKNFFPPDTSQSDHQSPNKANDTHLYSYLYCKMGNIYGEFRTLMGLPFHARKGIRLIAQVDFQQRRYVKKEPEKSSI